MWDLTMDFVLVYPYRGLVLRDVQRDFIYCGMLALGSWLIVSSGGGNR